MGKRKEADMTIMEVGVVPLGTGETSLSPYVARSVKVLREAGAKYEITAMGTIVEGELEELMALATRMHRAVFAGGVNRVLTTIKIDDRRDKAATMTGKVAAVKKALG